jgi:hypothetical protein
VGSVGQGGWAYALPDFGIIEYTALLFARPDFQTLHHTLNHVRTIDDNQLPNGRNTFSISFKIFCNSSIKA